MRTRRFGALVCAVGALSLGLFAGCSDDGDSGATNGETAAAGDPEKGGVAIIGQDQAPETLNGVLLAGNTVVTHQSISPMLEHMLTLTPDFEYVPVLAEAVPSEEDGTLTTEPFTLTFTIKEKAAWSDGTPVTADDMVFTWKTIMEPKNKVTGRTGWDKIEDIEILAPKQFKVILKEPYAPWKDLFSPSGGSTSHLLPKHVLEGKDFNTVWTRGQGMIGTGPYKIDSYTPDQRLVLVPNENYWNKDESQGGPHLERIVHVYLKETTTQQVQFESGEVNVINPPDFSIRPDLAELPNATVENPPGVTWEHLSFNNSDPLMSDVNVRRAIAYAVDPDELIETSTKNETVPLQSFLVPEQAPFYKASWEMYDPDPAKVDESLTASGYAKNADGFYEKDGKELEVEFSTIAGNETRAQNFRLMKAQLEKVGIKVKLNIVDNFFDTNGPLLTGRYQVAEFAFTASSDPTSTSIFRSDQVPSEANSFSGQNTYFLKDTELDPLLDASDVELNEGKRAELMQQIQDYLADNAVLFPLYQRPEILAYPDNLNNVLVNPTQVSHYDQTQNWFFTGGKASR